MLDIQVDCELIPVGPHLRERQTYSWSKLQNAQTKLTCKATKFRAPENSGNRDILYNKEKNKYTTNTKRLIGKWTTVSEKQ